MVDKNLQIRVDLLSELSKMVDKGKDGIIYSEINMAKLKMLVLSCTKVDS